MKKVLFIVNSLPFFLSHRKPIADELVKQGYEVHLAAGKMDATPPSAFFWHEIPLERGGINPLQELMVFFSIYRIINKVKPDLVHLVSIKPVLYGGIISNFFPNLPVVSAISGLGSIFTNRGKFKVLRFIISKLYKLALRKKKLLVIFQNTDDRDSIINLAKINLEKTRLIRGSGVDLNKYKYTSEPQADNIVVTMASRLLKDKGIIEFINASQELQSEKISFLVIGDIDPQNPESLTAKEVDHYKQFSNLSFIGHQNNIEDYFSQANIIVLPSYREGLPKVLCEAAACGRAVITTNVPGCRDAIINNKTGLLIPTKDPTSLAFAIKKLASDQDLRIKMGREGLTLAQREFDINKIIQKHLFIYKELGL